MCRIRPSRLLAKIAKVKRALETKDDPAKAVASDVGLHVAYVYKIFREFGYRTMHVSPAERSKILARRRRAAASSP